MAWTAPRTWTDGELVTAAIMNAHVRDNLNAVARNVAKTADESLASNTTLQNDDHLLFAMAANEYYSVRGTLWASNAADAGHLKIAFTVPASATYMMLSEGVDSGGATYAHTNHRSVSDTGSFFTTSTGVLVNLRGVVVCAGTAGNFTLQWAQATSNGTATFVKKGSHLVISKLG